MTPVREKYPKIVMSVFVFNSKKQLLMGKRIEKFGYGTWCMPGGKLKWGETLRGGAKRELKEETGITSNNLEYLHLVSDIEKKTHFVHADFIARKWSGSPKLAEPDKFSEWKWFDLGNLPKKLFIGQKKIISAFIKKTNFADNNRK